MQRSVEELSPTKKRFSIEISADAVEERIIDSLKKIGKTVKVPGFRPGKVPLSILDKRFGRDVEKDVLEELTKETYIQAIKEENVIPVAPPQFEEYQFKRRSPLKMTFTVECRPPIDNLNYDNLEVKEEEITAEDEEIERVLKSFAARNAKFTDVERPAQEDDLVTLDFEIIEEGKKFEKQMVQIGNKNVPEPLSEALKGKKKGEDFEVDLTLPEDFNDPQLAGKRVTIKGMVKEIKEVHVPEVGDDMAKEAGYKDVEEMKQVVREGIIKVKTQMQQERQKEEILEELLRRHEFPLPEAMVQEELDYLINQEKQQHPEASEEQLREKLKERAERNVKTFILLDTIVEREDITLTEEEIKNKIIETSYNLNMTPEVFMQIYFQDPENYHRFQDSLRREKLLDELLNKAKKIRKDEKTEEGSADE